MGQIRLSGEQAVDIHLKRSSRARRMSLRVSSVDGRVTLTLPLHVPERVARAFVDEKARWIGDAVQKCHAAVPVISGNALPVEGRMRQVVAGKGRAARLSGDVIEAPLGREGIAVEALIKHMARDRLAKAVDDFALKLGREASRLTLRDPRSRWGSCTSDGNLMFSWRLVLAPCQVLDYVAAHEVAHLQHMDHSRSFWKTVARLFPDYEAQRDWLRQEGAGLHRYRFRKPD